MNERVKRISKNIRDITAQYYETHSPRNSLVTVTGVDLAPDLSFAKISISVFPDHEDNIKLTVEPVLSQLRKALASKTAMKRVPSVAVELDRGESNRQRIDELLK